jgi:hypothetical protein
VRSQFSHNQVQRQSPELNWKIKRDSRLKSSQIEPNRIVPPVERGEKRAIPHLPA